MTRHLNEIKDLLFDEPDFDDEPRTNDLSVRKDETKTKKNVETIVFRDPAKRKAKVKRISTEKENKEENELDLEKARSDVHRFGIKGFEKSKYEDARVALAVSLGAKPPKRKFINYRQLIEENKTKKAKEQEEAENARILGDVFHKSLNKKKFEKKSKQKRIGRGDVGSMRFSSVGKFQGAVLKISDKEISRIKKSNNSKKK